MDDVEAEEVRLLEVCRYVDTTNDTHGRIFELMVVQRCRSSGVGFQLGDGLVDIGAPRSSEQFGGWLLPRLTAASPSRVYIPFDPTFPAIDLIVKHHNSSSCEFA
jgi:hypothetical protein